MRSLLLGWSTAIKIMSLSVFSIAEIPFLIEVVFPSLNSGLSIIFISLEFIDSFTNSDF